MIPRLVAALFVAVCLLVVPAESQAPRPMFDGQAAFDYVRTLSSDAMLGRKSGEPGGRMAADWVVSKFKDWGLEPAGTNGSYFQDMTIEYYEPSPGAALSIVAHGRTREFVYGEDWRQYLYSGSGVFGAGVVFVGYGISAPQKGYDEYAGLDVRNKLVLFAVETPRRFEESLKDEAQLQARIDAARDHGARGALTFRSDVQPAGPFFRGSLRKESYKSDFVALTIESRVVDFIFKWQKADPRYFFQQIEQTGKPQSYDLRVQSLLNLQVVFDEKRQTQNVLAKITGIDAALKNEYVIVGGHMDHLGVDMTGDILNGADDDASGTAVVMETARAMKRSGFAPKRTIIFAAWAAEEEGLLGSKYYTEHPIYPLEKTVANINLDMEGHGTGKVRASGSYYAPEVWRILEAKLPKAVLDNTVPGRGVPGGSDHTHFLYNGIPAFMVSTDGPHFKTNRVGDVIDLIRPEILQASGDFVAAALEILSTDPAIPIVPRRKETFYWRYETIVNHQLRPLEAVIQAHKDVQDPDVDVQLATVGPKDGSGGDSLRMEVMKALLTGKEAVARTAGLTLYGSPAAPRPAMMGSRGPSKTTVVLGLNGLTSVRNDLRWADVFSRQGIAFVAVDGPGFLFGEKGLSPEGEKVVEALGKAGILLIARGLNSSQARALLAATKKPIVLHASALPDQEILALVKSTGSTLGLAMAKGEGGSAYFGRLDAATKAVGPECVSIVAEDSLWQAPARAQMLDVISEMLKAGYQLDALASVTSGAFMRSLARARAADGIRP
jgi:Peptidase family M28